MGMGHECEPIRPDDGSFIMCSRNASLIQSRPLLPPNTGKCLAFQVLTIPFPLQPYTN